MKRIPLGDLSAALSNPQKYAKNFTGQSGGGGPSKYGMFLHSIGEFHRTGDLQKAQDYLEKKIEKFKNIADLPDYIQKLQVYVKRFEAQGNTSFRVRDNVAVPIPSEFSKFVVSGQTARIDLIPAGGYATWMFVRDRPDWSSDPRMPLIQFAYATKLGVALEQVRVGVYDFEVGQYQSKYYSSTQISKVRKQLKDLLEILNNQTT